MQLSQENGYGFVFSVNGSLDNLFIGNIVMRPQPNALIDLQPYQPRTPPPNFPLRPKTAQFPSYHNHQSSKPNPYHSRTPSNGQTNSHNHHRPTFTQSRISMANSQVSHLTNMLTEHDPFPSDLVFLLKSEQKNINSFKDKIQHQKSKVENDFAIYRTEIDHILEDVKLSVQAELDLVYKTYITKYAQLKGEVQELRMIRKDLLMNNQTGGSLGNVNVSNRNLIEEIEKDAEQMRNYKIYGYLGELQRQKLEPILGISNQLVMLGVAECSFYRNKELTMKLKDVKQHFGSFMRQVFDNLSAYVITPQFLAERERIDENSKFFQNESEHQSIKMRPFEVHYPSNTNNQDTRQSKDYRQVKKPVNFSISANQQGCMTNFCEDLRVGKWQRVQTDHSDSILCIHFLNSQYIATGSKDATINIYSLDGRKVRSLKGHEASICCLSSFKNLNGDTFLVSGSDHGCSSLILWGIRSWTITSKVQAHSAAVTGIVDLQDGRHIATGSYDKKIAIYSTAKNQIVLNLNNNKTSVTGMIMSVDRARLVTSGLDKSISVWSIIRKNGNVQQIALERLIQASELICQLQPSLLRPELIFCAARDGSLKLVNIISGREEKSLVVSSNSLIELVAIEREMSPDWPILLTCSAKDNSLTLAKMDSGFTSQLKLPSNLGIDYGCGIGPKIVLSTVMDGRMAIVSQLAGRHEFTIYELQLK